MAQFAQVIFNLLANIFGGSMSKPREEKSGPPTSVHDIDHIKKWEGLRLKAYLPTAHDVWTIGYGHTKTARKGMVITVSQAEDLLRRDLKWVENTIRNRVKVPLTQPQYDALAGLIYNIGAGAFSRSTVLRRLNARDYVGAAQAFMMWTKQTQNGRKVVLNGLVNRRKDEKDLFLKGTK